MQKKGIHNKRTNKEGLGPCEVAHKKQKNPKTRKKHNNKKNQKHPKKSFSVISQNLHFSVKKNLFDNLAQNARTPKYYKIGFQKKNKLYGKQICVTKRPFWEPKKPKSRNSSYLFLALFLLFQQQKHQIMLKLLFL